MSEIGFMRMYLPGVLVSAPLARSVNDQGKAHDLAQHLHATAELAAVFATRFDSADFARCAGLSHTLGKNALACAAN
jgi:hypothetical protein